MSQISITNPNLFNGSFEISSTDLEGRDSRIPYLELKVDNNTVFKTECYFRGLVKDHTTVPVNASYSGFRQKVYISESDAHLYEIKAQELIRNQSPSSEELSEEESSPEPSISEEESKIIDPRNFKSKFEFEFDSTTGKNYLTLDDLFIPDGEEFKVECSLEKTSIHSQKVEFSEKTVYISTESKHQYNELALKLINLNEEKELTNPLTKPSIDANELLFKPFIDCRKAIESFKERSVFSKTELNPTYKKFYRELFKTAF